MSVRWSPATHLHTIAKHSLRLAVLVCGMALLAVTQLHAQALNFKTYTGIDGLPQPQILAMHQDRYGYLWFGTYAGLSRFNGKSFTTQTTKNGLGGNTITAITEDTAGALIVGTGGGGICFSTKSSWRCLDMVKGSPKSEVNDLLVAGADIWVATEAGIARISGDRDRALDVQTSVPASRVSRLAKDAGGDIWAATKTGLLVLQSGRFVADTIAALRGVPIIALLPTPNGLLVGTDKALFLRTANGARRLTLPDASSVLFTDAAIDSAGIVWVSTRNGVLRYDGEHFTRLTRANGLVINNVNRVMVDREGLVWFGTDNGVSKLVPGPFELHAEGEGLPNSFVRAIVADRNGAMWFATRNGVAIRDGSRFRKVDLGRTLADPRFYALAPTPKGSMLMGTHHGLIEYYGNGHSRWYGTADGVPADFVASLLADSAGVWIGTEGGLAQWVNGTVRPIKHRSLPANMTIMSMAKDARGRLWMGLWSGGVVIWDGVAATRLDKSSGLTDQTIWSLKLDKNGTMWVGSNGDGAFLVNGSGIQRLDSRHGLVNDFVWQVLPDSHGDTWLYTSAGLDRYAGGRLRHYARGDGLLDPEGAATAAWEEANGDLWFGSTSGVTRYARALEVANVRPPSVYVERILSDGREIDRSNARIKFGDGVLQVQFASPSFRDEAGTRFRYRLIGTTDAWSEPTSESNIRYAGLNPGSYTFEVMAMDAGGLLSAKPAQLRFSILPAFWQHWLFRLFVGLLLVGLVATVPVLRNRGLEAERRRLEELVAQHTGTLKERNVQLEREISEREAAVQARERIEERLRQAQRLEAVGRLAGGIAHDFNNLLTSVVGHAELIGEELGTQHPLRPDLDEISRSAARGASLVTQLLAFSRQQIVKRSVLDLNAVVADSTRMLQRMLGADITLHVTLDPGLGCVRGDKSQIDQILVNLALNARDALPNGGTLTISTANVDVAEPLTEDSTGDMLSGPCVRLRVSDNGDGMHTSVRNRVFEPFFTTKEVGKGTGLGLSTVYGIVKQNDGHIVVDSAQGVGTAFAIYLPRVTTGESPDVMETSVPVTSAPSNAGGEVILVVEDEEIVRALVCRVLSRQGYHVLDASGGASAIAIAESHEGSIHLLVTDMIMPGLSGKDVAAAITVSRPDMRVLFMSGYTRDVLGSRGMLGAHTDLLPKPFGPAEIVERVRASLASAQHPMAGNYEELALR